MFVTTAFPEFKNSSVELINSPFFLVILCTKGIKKFANNFSENQRTSNRSNSRQNYSVQNKSSFHDLQKMRLFILEKQCLLKFPLYSLTISGSCSF